METAIGGAAFLGMQGVIRHAPQTLGHHCEVLLGPAFGGECRGLRFDNLAQFEQALEKGLVRIRIKHPAEDIRVKQVPFALGVDAGANLPERFHEALCA